MLDEDIYSLLMTATDTGKNLGRDQFKRAFFHFLYRRGFSRNLWTWNCDDGLWFREKNEEPVRKAMETLLPSIVFFLDLCKCQPGTLKRGGDDYKWISRAMQSIESQIMLECCTNLWKMCPKMFLNASLYTAVEGVNEWNRAETPSTIESMQPLDVKALKGKKWKEGVPHGPPKNPHSGGHGSRTRNTFRCTSFPMRLLAIRIPSEYLPPL